MPIALIALASLLAACSSGTTGMLPANPQTQSLAQTPNRAADAATSGGGMHATAHTPNGNTLLLGVNPAAGQSPIGATPVGNFGSGIGMARAMADQGPPSSCTSTGTCTTCPNGSQGDICEGGTGGGYNPDPPPPDGGGGGIPCQGQCGGGGRGPVTPCSKTNIKACVALRNPTAGAACWGSPGELGDNLPVSSVSSATEITDILPIEANNAAGAPDIAGWLYETQAGDWLQENPTFTDFWDTLAKQVPVLGPLASAMSNGGMVQANSSQWSSVTSYVNGHDGSIGQCFSQPLALT